MMHKPMLALVALSLAAPVAVFAQPAAPPPPPAPPAPAASPAPAAPAPAAAPRAPAPAPAAAPGGGRIEFYSNAVTQTAPEPKTGDRPVCRGDVVDSCIQPGAARQQRR